MAEAPVPVLTAALKCRCPRCGQGRLFQGLLTVRERCTVCDLDLRRVDTGDGAAVAVIFVLGAFDMIGAYLEELSGWIAEGKIQWKETVEDGIERAPDAFIKLFTGANLGKMLVKLG